MKGTGSGGVSLRGVTKRFGSVRALDDVSLFVQPGELLALLGPSGCGKTTLLRAVAGLEVPDAGHVLIGERDMSDVPVRERPIGMVFQHYALFPNLTVRQNIAFPLEVRGVPRDVARLRVEEMLALVRLEAQADRYPNQISGGQAQRCALGRALAPSPEVLLLDEPLSALDAVVRVRLRDEIRLVQQQVGITALYVTHDQSEAMAIADRVALMNHGRIEQLAPPSELYEAPHTQFAATFVGSRNAVELPVSGGRLRLPGAFDIAAPNGSDGRAICFFRPEDVEVADAHEPGLAAWLEMKVYLGATTRLLLRTELQDEPLMVHADAPSRRVQSLQEGSRVVFRVAADHVRAFPVDGPH
jgi:putative spermidine/putrescine transport system ATP-binding protein